MAQQTPFTVQSRLGEAGMGLPSFRDQAYDGVRSSESKRRFSISRDTQEEVSIAVQFETYWSRFEMDIFLNPHTRSFTQPRLPNPMIRKYHQSLPDYHVTPLHSLDEVARSLGVKRVLLKDESFRLGLPAFKVLGASWATCQAILHRLDLCGGDEIAAGEEVISMEQLGWKAQKAGLVLFAATDGNHGRAVARMARYLGISARIFVPKMLDEEAKVKIASEGAVIEVYNGNYDETVLGTKAACDLYDGGKGLLISDTALTEGEEVAAWIVEGYQTMFDELEEQICEMFGEDIITHVVTPVGVGSLSQAVVNHFHRSTRRERPSILTVEPKVAACLQASLASGEMVSVETGSTICSGLCCGTLSMNSWSTLRDTVTASITIDDKMADEAVRELRRYGIQAGPCGGATLAGLRLVSQVTSSLLPAESVVVIICTEGTRGYTLEQ